VGEKYLPVSGRVRKSGQDGGVDVLRGGEQNHHDVPVFRKNRLTISWKFVKHFGQ
jgi:hypothetical protein